MKPTVDKILAASDLTAREWWRKQQTGPYEHITEKALRELWPERWIMAKDTARACDGLSIVDVYADQLNIDVSTWLMTSRRVVETFISCPKCAVLRDQALEHYQPPEKATG